MASSGEDQSTASVNRANPSSRDDINSSDQASPDSLNSDTEARMPPTSANLSTSTAGATPTVAHNGETNSGIRQRVVSNAGPDVPRVPEPGDPPQPMPGETPQERRRRRLRRDREQLLSLINANPVACICILIAASFVVVGVGYFFYELHLAYKYSSIIQNLHVSSMKDGYGAPGSFSSSQKSQGKTKAPSPNSPSSGTPSGAESKKLPMLDEETEMYANQLQSVLSGLKRTLDRIDPTTNSTTLIAGLVQLKPADAETTSTPPFTTEVHADDAKSSSAQGTSPNEDLYTFLTKGPAKNAKVIADKNSLNQQQTQDEPFAQNKPEESFPDYLRDLKTSLEVETKKAQDKMDEWIEKHRHEYTNDDDWKEALEQKKAKEEDYNRFLDAMFYVAEELENDYTDSGLGALDNTNEEETVSLTKLLEILAKAARPSDDDEHASPNDVSGDADTLPLKKFGRDEKKAEDDWAYDAWDEDEDDDDWDDKMEKGFAEPQFA